VQHPKCTLSRSVRSDYIFVTCFGLEKGSLYGRRGLMCEDQVPLPTSIGKDWRMRSLPFIALLGILLQISSPGLAQSSPDAATEVSKSASVSLLKDRDFKRGIYLQSPDQQNRSHIGTIYPASGMSLDDPVWTFPQWHGIYPLTMTTGTALADGGVEYANRAKRAVFGPGARFILGLTGADRGKHTSKFVTEPIATTGISKIKTTAGLSQDTWVPGGEYIRLSEMDHLYLRLTARLLKAEPLGAAVRGTAAVSFVGLHIRNVDPARKELVYFVVPLYDSRERTRRTVRLVDAATGDRYFIYGTGNKSIIGAKSFHDKEWITINKDILPLVKDALGKVRKNPKFSHYSEKLADYTISEMNIRWEMSADMNVEMEFKDYDLRAQVKPSTPILSIVAHPTTVPIGMPTSITWHASGVIGDCTVRQDDRVLATQNSGSQRSEVLGGNSAFELACASATGATEVRRIVVKATKSACAVAAQPPTIARGQESELSWRSVEGKAASISPGVGNVPAEGKLVVRPMGRTNYMLTVGDPKGRYPTQCNAVVSVSPE